MIKNGRKYRPNRNKLTFEQKQSKNEYNIRKNKELVLWYKNLKKRYQCSRCGENDPRCLDFHHLDPETKITTVSWLMGQRRSKKVILEEIAKCEAICSNCHRKLTLEPY